MSQNQEQNQDNVALNEVAPVKGLFGRHLVKSTVEEYVANALKRFYAKEDSKALGYMNGLKEYISELGEADAKKAQKHFSTILSSIFYKEGDKKRVSGDLAYRVSAPHKNKGASSFDPSTTREALESMYSKQVETKEVSVKTNQAQEEPIEEASNTNPEDGVQPQQKEEQSQGAPTAEDTTIELEVENEQETPVEDPELEKVKNSEVKEIYRQNPEWLKKRASKTNDVDRAKWDDYVLRYTKGETLAQKQEASEKVQWVEHYFAPKNQDAKAIVETELTKRGVTTTHLQAVKQAVEHVESLSDVLSKKPLNLGRIMDCCNKVNPLMGAIKLDSGVQKFFHGRLAKAGLDEASFSPTREAQPAEPKKEEQNLIKEEDIQSIVI